MSQKTIKLLIGLIIIIFVVIAVKGFLLLSAPKQKPAPTAVATSTNSNIPDNLSISNEF